MSSPPSITRAQILSFRRSIGSLDDRLPHDAASFRTAAWAGLQDSVPRAALLSLHARLQGCQPGDWEHPALVQLWGPRYSVYAVAAVDRAVFSLGRLPVAAAAAARAQRTARSIQSSLGGRLAPFGQLGRRLGVPPNSLRYAAPTGSVLLRWDGARQPVLWSVPPPELAPLQARWELARRYLHIFGPGSPPGFSRWSGTPLATAMLIFEQLAPELTQVRTPLGERSILSTDEAALRAQPRQGTSVRLLPSGDTFFLAWGDERSLLVPDPQKQAELWTSRVWPGALLLQGEIAGTWRRADRRLSIHPWRSLTGAERNAVESEAATMPLPGSSDPVTLAWRQTAS